MSRTKKDISIPNRYRIAERKGFVKDNTQHHQSSSQTATVERKYYFLYNESDGYHSSVASKIESLGKMIAKRFAGGDKIPFTALDYDVISAMASMEDLSSEINAFSQPGTRHGAKFSFFNGDVEEAYEKMIDGIGYNRFLSPRSPSTTAISEPIISKVRCRRVLVELPNPDSGQFFIGEVKHKKFGVRHAIVFSFSYEYDYRHNVEGLNADPERAGLMKPGTEKGMCNKFHKTNERKVYNRQDRRRDKQALRNLSTTANRLSRRFDNLEVSNAFNVESENFNAGFEAGRCRSVKDSYLKW